jgi:hypothetical protein
MRGNWKRMETKLETKLFPQSILPILLDKMKVQGNEENQAREGANLISGPITTAA